MNEISVSQNEIKRLLKRLGLKQLGTFYYKKNMDVRTLDVRVGHLVFYTEQLTKEIEQLKSQIKILKENDNAI